MTGELWEGTGRLWEGLCELWKEKVELWAQVEGHQPREHRQDQREVRAQLGRSAGQVSSGVDEACGPSGLAADPGHVLGHPGVHSGEVSLSTALTEAHHARQRPRIVDLVNQRAARVSLAGVAAFLSRTNHVVGEGGVTVSTRGLGHDRDHDLLQLIRTRTSGAERAPAGDPDAAAVTGVGIGGGETGWLDVVCEGHAGGQFEQADVVVEGGAVVVGVVDDLIHRHGDLVGAGGAQTVFTQDRLETRRGFS